MRLYCTVDMFRNSKGSSGNTVLYCGAVSAMVSKCSESFDNNVFFDIEAKRTRSIEKKFFQSEANMFILRKEISKRSEGS
jgi:hypothetical protein